MSELGQGIQVVLQTEDSGRYRCEGFSGIPVVTPAFIVITSSGSPQARQVAAQLRRELSMAILSLGEQASPEAVPCGGWISNLLACHAHRVPHCSKLLVWVGDTQAPAASQPALDSWLRQGSGHPVLAVLPSGTSAYKALPSSIKHLNADFWSTSIVEVIPSIFSVLGLTATEFRIFISYRQVDTRELADQLFDALSREGFDVFLDRFRVPPAVDFQARLTQELADKAMVLILESARLLESEWTQHEINFAKLHRLGVLALQVPGGVSVTGIDSDLRKVLASGDFLNPAVPGMLTATALPKVVEYVKVEHGRALVRRRKYLRDTMEAALLAAGVTGYRLGSDGLLHIPPGHSGKEYAVLLTTRPPGLPDFHITDRRRQTPATGIVIGPAAYMVSANKERLDWLCQVSKICCFDEAQMADVAKNIAGEVL